ncbi:HET-domain-containing protein [Triangularia verruculosa]|uniref:HET-domain-containing protein n=1 Tax=Triangularia verruculosa TaxID=2587418 RepID=A0AAN6X823_9PEZI|nr:HET-domain-containing protein [Triangularia verruculosa]
MRLLKARSLEFEEFLDEKTILLYAILSHRWENEEITYKEILKPTRKALAEAKRGFQKIRVYAAKATKNSLEYLWVNIYYIDKTSSTELSKAINSMFRWYRAAAVCYAYLCDVPPPLAAEGLQDFKLIALRKLVFYINNWMPAGTKKELARPIAPERKTTRIEDTAYCMLGLFDINMPMLYGEGERAFIRL